MLDPGPRHGHVIVCGLDHLGRRTIDELRRRDEEVVAIGPSRDAEEWLTSIGVRLVVGDPLVPAVLRGADVERAHAVVMTAAHDLDNLNIALAAHEHDPGARLVLRMFDTELVAATRAGLADLLHLAGTATPDRR
jgi:Trk K+ transport system NAD-binding subunit